MKATEVACTEYFAPYRTGDFSRRPFITSVPATSVADLTFRTVPATFVAVLPTSPLTVSTLLVEAIAFHPIEPE